MSDLEKIVSQAENIYFLMKENGLKPTVNFQLNFSKDKKQEEPI